LSCNSRVKGDGSDRKSGGEKMSDLVFGPCCIKNLNAFPRGVFVIAVALENAEMTQRVVRGRYLVALLSHTASDKATLTPTVM
jgi:hypothetical protein